MSRYETELTQDAELTSVKPIRFDNKGLILPEPGIKPRSRSTAGICLNHYTNRSRLYNNEIIQAVVCS